MLNKNSKEELIRIYDEYKNTPELKRYNAYLEHNVINFDFIISANQVLIQNSNTVLCNIKTEQQIIQKDILNIYSAIIDACALHNVKIKYPFKIKKQIITNWDNYVKAHKYYEKLFEEIKNKALIVQNIGIKTGYSDDILVNELLNLKFKYSEMYYANNLCNIKASHYYRLLELLKEIKHSKYDSISL